MSYFSEFDKTLIRNIVNENGNSPKLLGELLSTVFPHSEEYGIFTTIDPLTCHIFVSTHHIKIDIYARIVDFISIISFLEQNKYIVLINSRNNWGRLFFKGITELDELSSLHPINTTNKGNGILLNEYLKDLSNGQNFKFEVTNKDGYTISVSKVKIEGYSSLESIKCEDNLLRRLNELLNSYAYPTHSVRNLAKNNFMSEEDIYNARVLSKADKQISEAHSTLIIAVLTLLITAIGVIAQPFDFTVFPLIKLVDFCFNQVLNLFYLC